MWQTLKQTRLPKLAAILLLSVCLVAASGCGKSKVVATYDGGTITEKELSAFTKTMEFLYGYTFTDEDSRWFFAKQLAGYKVMSQQAGEEAKQKGKDAAVEQVERMETLYSNLGYTFKSLLKDFDLTKADLETFFRQYATSLFDMESKITDEQIQARYDEMLAEDPNAFTVVSVAHILISTKDPNDVTGQTELRTKEEALERAKEVKSKLDAGEDFAQLAAEFSDDPGSKNNGGKYENNYVATTSWDPAFMKQALEQPVGEIGEPFESSFGYHIMRVDKREVQPLDAVKESLRSDLAGEEMIKFIEEKLEADFGYSTTLPVPSEAVASPSSSPSPDASPAE